MPKSNRRSHLVSIASTIADYRQGEIQPPDPDHVDKWIRQFDDAVQEPILVELDHVLKKTYFSKQRVEEFLAAVLTQPDLSGANPCDFWRRVNFLNIQTAGNSQREMLVMFDEVLQRTCGLRIAQCGSEVGPYIYLDDGIFTGNRIKSDLLGWISSNAPAKAALHVIVIAFHRGGQYYAEKNIEEACKVASKVIDIKWRRSLEIEDRKAYTERSDVLRPSSIPTDSLTQAYVQGLRYPPVIRSGDSLGANAFFSSVSGRNVIEQEMLKAGVYIRSICPYLNIYQRPLGNMLLESLGFGSTLVTFRNCANNCPLAFWAGNPWYPLFPRKTN